MGKVQDVFYNGRPGAISRSVDDIVISVKNASEAAIPFGAPVFLTENGAVPFDISDPQAFTSFLGFAVRVPDKTPETYPQGQYNDPPEGVWNAGDVMEVLVRGSIVIPMAVAGSAGGAVFIRKSDGQLTASAGSSGSTVELTNVHVRNPRGSVDVNAEVVVSTRNIL